jgi:hypothetical protein
MHRERTSFLIAAFANQVHGDVENAVFGKDFLPDLLGLLADALLERGIALARRLKVQGVL